VSHLELRDDIVEEKGDRSEKKDDVSNRTDEMKSRYLPTLRYIRYSGLRRQRRSIDVNSPPFEKIWYAKSQERLRNASIDIHEVGTTKKMDV
jgi:hypothetical protein